MTASGQVMTIDVLMGGPGREAEVSRKSGRAVAAGLRRQGQDVAEVDLPGRLGPRPLRPGAVVFNLIHGTYGEDGQLLDELEARGISYVGSGPEASRLCMDKPATKRRLQEAGIKVPWGVVVDLAAPFDLRALHLPHHGGLVLKPADDGSSVGLRLVANPGFVLPAIEEILREVGPRRYLIEERLPGPEYTVAVIDGPEGPMALPPIQVVPAQGAYDYSAKYHRDDTRYDVVGDAVLARTLGSLAVSVHRRCGCRDLSRTDIMATAGGDLAVLEINTLPGFTDHSLVPKAALAAGIAFDHFVVQLATKAWGRRRP